ncbi:MAG TPA: hypothetical protein VFB81_23170, partial [Myxococcales bacterium]|nr:hypothetical protein [Myxococcales bacterium]
PGLPTAGGVGAALGPFTLERRRLDGVAIASGAPPLPVTVASSSVSAGFATDAGASTWTPSLTVTIPAGAPASGQFFLRDTDAGRPAILLSAGLSWQPAQQVQSVRGVRFSRMPGGAAPVGGSAVLTVQAVDLADVTGLVNLSARLLQLDGGAAATARFSASTIGTPGGTQVSGTAASGAATLTVTDSRAEPLRVCGSITSAPASESCASVSFAAMDHLRLSLVSPGTMSPLEGCAPQTIKVQMEDAMNNPVASPSPASMCAPTDAGLVRGPSTLAGETRTAACVLGNLGNDGSATWELTPSFPVGVTIGAASGDVPGGDAILPVEWVAGAPAPDRTIIAPRDTTGPLTMTVGRGVSWVRMMPRDACGFPATGRSSEVILLIPEEISYSEPFSDLVTGVYDFPIRLEACPPGAAAISIRGRVGNQPLVDQTGAERVITINPQCGLRQVEVGCDCGAGPGAGPRAAALALLALTLRAARRRWRRRERPRSAAAP